jgi:hypothetical protein
LYAAQTAATSELMVAALLIISSTEFISIVEAREGTRKNTDTKLRAVTSPTARMAYPSEARRRELVKIARINRSMQTKLIITTSGEADFMKVS